MKKPLYKSYQMEEFLDICFYHPLGLQIAKAGRKINMTADQITYISMILGIIGGLMLSSMSTAFIGFGLLVLSSIFDSADGQLARMTGKTTLRGRILDGMIGYASFTSSYIGLTILYINMPNNRGLVFMLVLAVIGGIFSAFQSSMYDFYRTTFASIVSKGRLRADNVEDLGWLFRISYAGYNTYQRFFARSHLKLLSFLRKHYPDGNISQESRDKYLKFNRRIIRGWNLLGDNMRFIIILACLILYRPQWYFFFIIGPLSLVMLMLIALQCITDNKFINSFCEGEK